MELMNDLDENRFALVAEVLGGSAESWRAAFVHLECVAARPGEPAPNVFGPAEIAEVIASDSDRGNGGYAQALVRLTTGEWASIDAATEDTCGSFFLHSSRGYVSKHLTDVVLYGLSEDSREHLAIPNDVDRALAWAKDCEEGRVTSMSSLVGMLPGRAGLWRLVFQELTACEHIIGPVGSARGRFGPHEIVDVVGARQSIDGGSGWMAAIVLTRLSPTPKDRVWWASVEATIQSVADSDGPQVDLSLPVVKSSLAAAAWQGLSTPSKHGMGIPTDEPSFRIWAARLVERYEADLAAGRRGPAQPSA